MIRVFTDTQQEYDTIRLFLDAHSAPFTISDVALISDISVEPQLYHNPSFTHDLEKHIYKLIKKKLNSKS